MNCKTLKIILTLFILFFLIIIFGVFILSPIMIKEAKIWAESSSRLSYFQKMILFISYLFRIYGGLLIGFWIYTYIAFCLQIIAIKTKTENGWFAWIPIANIYLMCKIARKPAWWLLLFFIPIFNMIILVIVGMGIAKACKKPAGLGILTIVPIANLIMLGYLAFSE